MHLLKVCGITSAAFAVGAAERGVNYLGFVFAAASPRRVTPDQARAIVTETRRSVPCLPRFVGVFVEHSADEIADIAAFVGLDVVQLHGDYGDDAVAAIRARGYEVWRLCNAARGCDEKAADAILLDGRRGNESHRADWSLVEPLRRDGCRVVLAGGISADNITAAIATGADVIDVNSSIEVAPGRKSLVLLDELLAI